MTMPPSVLLKRGRAAAITGAVLLGALAVGCGDSQAAVDEPAPAEIRRVINVEAQDLQRQRFADVIQVTGTVVADRRVDVAADEGGTVRTVLVDKGERVEAGQPLVRLDDNLLRAQRDEAQAQASLASQLWDRVRKLYEDDGIGTESAYLESRYGAQAAAARLAQLEERLARAVVRAPFAGILDARFVEVGSVVAPATPVASILDLEPLKVMAGIPERYAGDVHVGSEARIVFPSLGDTTAARVSYVGAAVNDGNRTFPIELELAHNGGVEKPQMVADIVLQRRVLDGVVVVPRQALVRAEEGFTAFVVDGSGAEPVAVERQVTLGPSDRDLVVITDGLAAAEQLIVVGQHAVANGDRVRIVHP